MQVKNKDGTVIDVLLRTDLAVTKRNSYYFNILWDIPTNKSPTTERKCECCLLSALMEGTDEYWIGFIYYPSQNWNVKAPYVIDIKGNVLTHSENEIGTVGFGKSVDLNLTFYAIPIF